MDIYGSKPIHVWGVVPGNNDINIGKWGKIKPGDVTLFAGNNKIFASAVVTLKSHNKELALELWGTDNQGETWEYIYFLDEVKELNIPYSIFKERAVMNQIISFDPSMY